MVISNYRGLKDNSIQIKMSNLIPSKVTLVSCLFDLPARENNLNRRQISEYIYRSECILSLDQSIIFYVDAKFIPYIQSKRNPEKTLIIPTSLEELPYYAYHDKIKELLDKHPIEGAKKDKYTSRYLVLISSKLTMMKDALERNPFKSTHFGWIDFGIRKEMIVHAYEDRVFEDISDKIRLMMIQAYLPSDFNDLEKHLKCLKSNMSAIYMTGSRENYLKFCDLYDTEFKDILNKNLIGSEEQIIPLITVKYPDLFEFYYGDLSYHHAFLNYKRIRGGLKMIGYTLRRFRIAKDYARCCEIGGRVWDSLQEGILVYTPEELHLVLDEYYIAAYYLEYPKQHLAYKIAKYYVDRALIDEKFYDVYKLHQKHIQDNFSFLNKNPIGLLSVREKLTIPISSKIPRIYCINLKNSIDRRAKMEAQFREYGLLDQVIFVEAIHKDSPLLELYHPGTLSTYKKAEIACFVSHLKALYMFLEKVPGELDYCRDSTELGALICEDDIVLHKDFISKYSQLMQSIPKGTSLISLCNFVFHLNNFTEIPTKNSNIPKIYQIVPELTWGAQMYWISQNYAIEALSQFNKNMQTVQTQHVKGELKLTSELIIQKSKGLVVVPPLALEDTISSNIRDDSEIIGNRNYFSQYDYSNYWQP